MKEEKKQFKNIAFKKMNTMYKIKRPSLKILINSTFLFVLGKAIVFLSKHDMKIKESIKKLKIDSIKMSIMGMKNTLLLKKEQDTLKKISKGNEIFPEIEIFFKNIDTAFLLLTGQIGTEQGFAEHRIFLKGNISNALIFTEILKRVEAILFPGFFHKKLFREKPRLTTKDYILRVRLYILTPLWLIELLFKGKEK